ncbi:MAG: lysophospholipase [Actinomycetota bacterium]
MGGETATRSAVLLVHGIGEHSGRYDHVGRFLADRGHDVVAVDNRGHGQTGGRRGYVDRFAQFLDDVEDQLAERRKLGVPVVLFGHSLGGLISANYVVDGRPPPDLLILSSPAIKANVPTWQSVMAPILSRIAPKVFIKSDLDPAALADDAEIQRAYVDDPLRVGGATARMGNEIFAAMDATGTNLTNITMPTFVFHGTDDAIVPQGASQPLADLDNVTYRLWDGLRHECMNEPSHPEVLGEVEAWLGTQLDA